MRKITTFLAAWGLISGLALTSASAQPVPTAEHKVDARPFTGYLKIRQQNGVVSYEFTVVRGKVTSGTSGYGGPAGVTHDIVGGWYDREHLMLLLQTRSENVADKWSCHAHQFKKSATGFILEHTLYGYGKTMATGEVYQPHVIDKIAEVSANGDHAD